MKKIINKPETVVDEMCRGLVMSLNGLEYIEKYKIVKKKEANKSKVSLISGGGSGHEPAHAGFVGYGMLDAAVCGDVFASPSQIQVYQGIRAVAGEKGVLLIIKNYSGDIMNFQNAAFLAETDGIKVDYVKVDDDIAVMDSLYTVGRRGVAGTVLVHKIAGAASETGAELQDVKRIAEKAAASVRSIGFAYTSCTVPAKGSPTFSLEEDEMEYGVGIHGEPGIRREKILSADELAKRMVASLIENLKPEQGQELAVLVNGFGATPLQELYLLNHSVMKELSGFKVFRSFVGNYMTSIDMAGASVSVMKLDDELKQYLSARCEAHGFFVTGKENEVSLDALKKGAKEGKVASAAPVRKDVSEKGPIVKDGALRKENIAFLVEKMGDIIIENEVPFCDLDSHAGDGDFGMSVAKGFKQLRAEWDAILQNHFESIGDFLDACSMVIMEHCGGASGPIWGFAFKSAGKSVGEAKALDVSEMARMLGAAAAGIQAVGERSFGRGAGVGDKTLMDALIPCTDEWKRVSEEGGGLKEAFEKGAEAAVRGAESTKEIVARMGRAGTVGERSLGYPDAGAHALGVIFTALAGALEF